MNKEEIDVYAFPIILGDVRAANGGLTKVEYFAARAPAEPQAWFHPKMAEPRPEAAQFPEMNREQKDEWDAMNEGFLEPKHAKDRTIASAYEQREQQAAAIRAYDKKAEKQRLIQWPFAWARAVLAAGEQV